MLRVWIALVGAVALTAIARRVNVPYPSLLALGGVALALFPGAPKLELDPELMLALFVAPVLLDAAYDTSVRDLRANWIPITCLVIAAVGITTFAVAWTVHALDFDTVVPMSLLSIVGSVIAGYLLARLYMRLAMGMTDIPSSIVLQFAGTFGVWILAEHLHLSAIVTVVVYGITVARDAPRLVPARNRLPSYAVWDLVVFVLNVLAFVLIGLQLRPILAPLAPAERLEYFQIAAIVLSICIAARFVWAFRLRD